MGGVIRALLLVAAASGQVTVAGRVVDSRGAPVAGAVVTVSPAGISTSTGADEEDVFGARATTFSGSKGGQRSGAVFLEDLWTPSGRLAVDVALRADGWQDFDAELASGRSRGAASTRLLARPWR